MRMSWLLVPFGPLVNEPPTAATVPSLRTVTAVRTSFWVELVGLGMMLQLVPSKCSVRVLPESPPLVPTAQTLFSARAVTAVRTLSNWGETEGTVVQEVPSK